MLFKISKWGGSIGVLLERLPVCIKFTVYGNILLVHLFLMVSEACRQHQEEKFP